MNEFNDYYQWFVSLLNTQLFKLGESSFTLKAVIIFIFSLILLFWITALIKKIFLKRVFPRYNLDIGVSESISTIIRYMLMIIGLIIIFQTSGIDLSAIGILLGALGIGIGFGLQNITSNFISGIIILFERPVKVGDRIEVDGIAGNIIRISARATTIITNDNIAIIIPNSDFISGRVINWSHNDRNIRLNFPVGVAYKEDPEKIRSILIEVAKANTGILNNPEPDVLFDEYGDSSLNFLLRVWTTKYIDKPHVLKSQLYYAIFKKFKEHNVEIPFPQRDLHFKSGFSEKNQLPDS